MSIFNIDPLRSSFASCCDRIRLKTHIQAVSNRTKNRNQIVHPGVARREQHPVQALAGLGLQSGELFKPDGHVNEVEQDDACRFRLTV
jgi:hypothetical protein